MNIPFHLRHFCIVAINLIGWQLFFDILGKPGFLLPRESTTVWLFTSLAKGIGLHPVHGYALNWWVPLLGVTIFSGWRYSIKSSALYNAFAVILFLVLIHNFRGFGTRHNVFEFAESLNLHPIKNVPSPILWDLLYVPISALGTLTGYFLSRISKLNRSEDLCSRDQLLKSVLPGFVSTLLYIFFTVFRASKTDTAWWNGSFTLGYACLVTISFLYYIAFKDEDGDGQKI